MIRHFKDRRLAAIIVVSLEVVLIEKKTTLYINILTVTSTKRLVTIFYLQDLKNLFLRLLNYLQQQNQENLNHLN